MSSNPNLAPDEDEMLMYCRQIADVVTGKVDVCQAAAHLAEVAEEPDLPDEESWSDDLDAQLDTDEEMDDADE